MKKLILTFLPICICALNLFAQSTVTNDEYAIYDAVLERKYLEILNYSGDKIAFAVMAETIETDFVPSNYPQKSSVLDYSYSKLRDKSEDLLQDFRKKNVFSVKLQKQSPTDYIYNVISKDEIDKLFEEGKKESSSYQDSWNNSWKWQPLRRNYPNTMGLIKFSRIGFSSNQQTALVFIDNTAADSDHSEFFTLEKVNGKWVIQNSIDATNWIS